jgi:hypothetical protein
MDGGGQLDNRTVAGNIATTLADAATGAVGAFQSSIDRFSDAAVRNGPSGFLMGLGTTLILLPVAARIDVAGEAIVSMTSGDFIALVVSGLLLVLAGAALRFYWLKAQLELAKQSRELGEDLFKQVATAATDLAKSQPSPPGGGAAPII